MNVSNNSSIVEFFACSLQVVYIVINISILGIMLFFKMYSKFVYRLLFYTVAAVILSEIIGIASLLKTINMQNDHVEYGNKTISIVFDYLQYASLMFFYLLLTSIGICLFLLAIYHHQFTTCMADLVFLTVCLILS